MRFVSYLIQRIPQSLLQAGLICVLLGGCTTAELAVDLLKKTQKSQEQTENAQKLADRAVVAAPRYKIGDPYNVGGVWYYPTRDLSYDESGIGSWYGDEFAGRLTANGWSTQVQWGLHCDVVSKFWTITKNHYLQMK